MGWTVKSGKTQGKALRQAYVKDSLTRAFQEVRQAKRTNRRLQTADDFLCNFA